MKKNLLIFIILVETVILFGCKDNKSIKQPNILFALGDDWSWPHASIAYEMSIPGSDNVIKTPNFDRIARGGILFKNAFCSAPSCGPSRSAILTGRNMWQLETGANLRGVFPNKFGVYTDALEEAGYHVGYIDKGCTPMKFIDGRNDPAGKKFNDFKEFMYTKTSLVLYL